MKTLILLHLVILSLFASDMNELYKKALELEKQDNYKEAMKIYKEIASHNIVQKSQATIQPKSQPKANQKLEQSIVEAKEPDSQVPSNREEFLYTIMSPIEDKESEETTKQLISSSFDIYAYKTNYFLPISYDTKERSDREQTEAKFQISFKKPLSYNLFGMNESINFAYTQTSWWQLYADSGPFRETNYQPEIFMAIPYEKDSALKAYKFAFLHESNGQGGDISRSWNRLYAEAFFQYDSLFIIPKVWYRIPESDENDDNPDITHYMGYGDLTFLYTYKKNTFKLKLRNNLNFSSNKGAAEFEYAFPLTSDKQSAFGFVQLFSGYGESLIDYNVYMNKISIGFAISR